MKTLFRTALLLVCGFPLFACTPHAASDAPLPDRGGDDRLRGTRARRGAVRRAATALRSDSRRARGLHRPGYAAARPSSVSRSSTAWRSSPLCDKVPAHVERAQRTLSVHGLPAAQEFTGADDWRRVCELEGVDPIYNCTDWQMHVPIALYAMERGKARGRRGACGADRRRLLGAGRRGRTDAPPLHDARELLLRLLRDDDAQHGARGAVRRDRPCRGGLYPRPARIAVRPPARLRRHVAARTQCAAYGQSLSYARPGSVVPASCSTSTAATAWSGSSRSRPTSSA